MFSVGVLIGVAGLLTFLAGGAMYYGRLLDRLEVGPVGDPKHDDSQVSSARDVTGSVDAVDRFDRADSGEGLIIQQARSTPLLEAVELTRVSAGRHVPDRLRKETLGRYSSRIQAILKIEATRQRYRAAGEVRYIWFYICDTETARLVWYVEGLASTPNVVDLREVSATRAERV